MGEQLKFITQAAY